MTKEGWSGTSGPTGSPSVPAHFKERGDLFGFVEKEVRPGRPVPVARRKRMTTATGSTGQTPTRRVVVGIDGSDGSNRALEWAAAEAARMGAVLEAHTSYSPGYVFVTSQEVHEAMQHVLDTAKNCVADLAPGLVFEGSIHDGPAAEFLIEASKGADLLVVGSRGLGGFSGLLLGSVSRHCSLHAHCPVVIVRPTQESGKDESSQ